MKNLGLPSSFSQLLLEPLPILFLSPEPAFLVTPALADICFTKTCSFLLDRHLSQKWSVIEQFGYHIWIQQSQACKDHPSFLEGGN
jgi:hypothetical protein